MTKKMVTRSCHEVKKTSPFLDYPVTYSYSLSLQESKQCHDALSVDASYVRAWLNELFLIEILNFQIKNFIHLIIYFCIKGIKGLEFSDLSNSLGYYLKLYGNKLRKISFDEPSWDVGLPVLIDGLIWLIDQGRTRARAIWMEGEIPAGTDNTYCCGANLWCKLFCLNHIIISPAAGKETVQPSNCHQASNHYSITVLVSLRALHLGEPRPRELISMFGSFFIYWCWGGCRFLQILSVVGAVG